MTAAHQIVHNVKEACHYGPSTYDGRFHADQSPAPFRRRHRSPPATAAGRATPARTTGPLSARSAAPPPPPSAGADRSSATLRRPLALTVNYCAPIAEGAFDLDVRLVKANRSSQHWCVELTQDGGEVATLATAVFADAARHGRTSRRHFRGNAVRTGPPLSQHDAAWATSMIFASSRAIRAWRHAAAAPRRPIPSCGSATACRERSTCCR